VGIVLYIEKILNVIASTFRWLDW